MSPASPNFDGFADAQSRLREHFGHEVTVFLPGTEAIWPPGTKLDPESGEPYDPTITPASGGVEVQTTVLASVVHRPMGLSERGIEPETERAAIGWVEEGGVVLIVDESDKDEIEDATAFIWADERYTIRQTDTDYLGPVGRYLIWGKQAGAA